MEKFSNDMQELYNLLQNPNLNSNKQLPKEACKLSLLNFFNK